MIHELHIDNYGSFPYGFRFTTDKGDPDDDSNTVSAVFGMNGFGKTNIVGCVESIQNLLLAESDVEDFISKLNKDHNRPDTLNFGISFDAYGRLFRYEATLDVRKKRFAAESIRSTIDGETYSVLETVGSRCKLNPIKAEGVKADLYPLGAKTSLIHFFDEFPVRNTSVKFKKEHGDVYDSALQELLYFAEWFKSLLSLVKTNSILSDVDVKSLSALLRSMDLDLKPDLVDVQDSEIIREIRAKTIDRVSPEVIWLSKRGALSKTWLLLVDSNVYYANMIKGDFSVRTLEFKNNNGTINTGYSMLSAGQKRLIELSPMISSSENDHVYVVDEIDRKLHTNLTLQLIRLFLEKEGHRQQMIFTTHETEIIDSGLADPSNMWITDRTDGEGSFLYRFPSTGFFDDPKAKFIDNDLL